jgi:hypothetical protein
MAGIEIRIDDNFMALAEAFTDQLGPNELVNAGRSAFNKTLLTIRNEAIKELRKRVRIKPGVLRNKYTWLEKARGGTLGGLTAAVAFSTRPIPMIEFVRGNKAPIVQKGVPVKRRRKLKVEIVPGKRHTLDKAFIQKVHTTQVFKRDPKADGFHKQGTRSIGFLIAARGIGAMLADIGQARVRNLLLHEFDVRAKKIVITMSNAKAGSRGGSTIR